jgi:mannose-6-phosphate isomerase-like protein (cupin superfamily)
MARLIEKPTVIAAVGNKPKRIEEFVGQVNTRTNQVSIARMHSSPGWEEPGQTPAFDEFTLVLAGMLRVETQTGILEVGAGQAVHAPAGNGYVIARQSQRALNMCRCAYRRFHRTQCIVTPKLRHGARHSVHQEVER